MKNISRALTLFTAVFATIFMSSCEDGKDGINGADGKDTDYVDFSNPLTASKTPNFLKLNSSFSSVTIKPILSSEDVIPSSPKFVYGSMADGAGLLNNSDGSYTLINNIEADYSIARIILNSKMEPVKGEYILNANATAFTAQCSGSLITPKEHGFGPLYLSGGEWGGGSKGVFVTSPEKRVTDASFGNLLSAFGQWSTENAVVIGKDAYPKYTVAFIGDDHADNSVPSGQLGMYVGRRGDLYNGKLYGLKVTPGQGVSHEVDMVEGTEYNAEFVELLERDIDLLDAEAKAKGVIGFSRLEDIDWRRGTATNQREIYFCVTGRNKPGLVGKGSILGRVYRLKMNETNPTGVAKITCVLDGDKVGGKADGFHSPDNIVVTENYAYIQEDPNGYASVNPAIKGYAKLYQYNLNTGVVNTVLECDQNTAAAQGYGKTTKNWELTGMIDITDITKSAKSQFLLITQNHGWEKTDGTPFTDPKANPASNSRKEGSVLYLVEGLER